MKRAYPALLALGSLTACASVPDAPENRWTELFDGETLDGWFVHNGDLPFTVRSGEIVGATAVDIPNRYLTTEERYGDFILELEMNNADGENSGIQFRSVTDAPFFSGLTGYQLEVDPSERGWTGGIYFEGVGTWQHPPLNNPACLGAWREEDWNALRIEARGELVRTFVNGVPCAYLFDQYLAEGHIGLQVHGIGSNPDAAGAETRWRNIRILPDPEPSDYTRADNSADSASHLIGRLSPAEQANGWEVALPRLASRDHVRSAPVSNPINGQSWTAELLDLNAAQGPVSANFALPEASYNFLADVQITPGTSGEMTYPVRLVGDDGSTVRCTASYRIFDDRSLETRSEDDPDLMGSLTGMIAARNFSEAGRPKRVLYGDAWRRFGILVDNGRVEHWLNAVKVVEYTGCGTMANREVSADAITIRIDRGIMTVRTAKLRATG